MSVFSFDGRGLKALAAGLADAYYTATAPTRHPTAGNVRAEEMHARVAYVFRCVTKRANEISRIPRALLDESGKDVTEQYKDLMVSDDLLHSFEASRCLAGAAYAIIDVNRYGLNPTLRWVITPSIDPRWEGTPKKLTHFYRTEERPPRLDPSRVVYIWNKNFTDETQPGLGESQVALGPASGLDAIGAMTAAYFNGGAVRVTVFPVPPSTQESDRRALQSWLNRRLSGMGNAFRNIVMRVTNLNPVVIGSDLKDTAAVELSREMREDIALAHGMTLSIVSGDYKYATADSQYLAVVAGTFIPRADQTFEILTKQFYSRFGLRLVTQPHKMEVLQAAQLAQVQAVVTATGGRPFMTVQEARALVDLKKDLSVAERRELGLELPRRVWPTRPAAPPRPVPVAKAPRLAGTQSDARYLADALKTATEALTLPKGLQSIRDRIAGRKVVTEKPKPRRVK